MGYRAEEEDKLRNTRQHFFAKSLDNKTNDKEKKACNFYLKELDVVLSSKIAAEDTFRKFEQGVGSSGDDMVFKKALCWDADGNPKFNDDGNLKFEVCLFENMAAYCDFIKGKKNPRNEYDLSDRNGCTQECYSEFCCKQIDNGWGRWL